MSGRSERRLGTIWFRGAFLALGLMALLCLGLWFVGAGLVAAANGLDFVTRMLVLVGGVVAVLSGVQIRGSALASRLLATGEGHSRRGSQVALPIAALLLLVASSFGFRGSRQPPDEDRGYVTVSRSWDASQPERIRVRWSRVDVPAAAAPSIEILWSNGDRQTVARPDGADVVPAPQPGVRLSAIAIDGVRWDLRPAMPSEGPMGNAPPDEPAPKPFRLHETQADRQLKIVHPEVARLLELPMRSYPAWAAVVPSNSARGRIPTGFGVTIGSNDHRDGTTKRIVGGDGSGDPANASPLTLADEADSCGAANLAWATRDLERDTGAAPVTWLPCDAGEPAPLGFVAMWTRRGFPRAAGDASGTRWIEACAVLALLLVVLGWWRN